MHRSRFRFARSVVIEARSSRKVVCAGAVIAGILSLAISCVVLLVAIFASVLVSNQPHAMTSKDATLLLFLYGIAIVFFLGGISLMFGGGRWFIRSLISFGRRGGSGRI